LPPNNSFTIWAEIYGKTKTGKKLRKRLYAWVNVYDAYKVQVIHEFTGRAGMGSKLIDSASFIVWVYSYKREVSGIRNYSPKVLKEGRNGPFKEKINVDDALGTIHITEGIKNDSLSKDYPPEVYFEFTPNEVLLYKSQYSARGIPSDITPVFSKSLPEEINFIANGQVQRYNIYAASANYKLIVTPFRQ